LVVALSGFGRNDRHFLRFARRLGVGEDALVLCGPPFGAVVEKLPSQQNDSSSGSSLNDTPSSADRERSRKRHVQQVRFSAEERDELVEMERARRGGARVDAR
jgi:hypothetical protein